MKLKSEKSKSEMVGSYFSSKRKLIGWPHKLDKTGSYILSEKTNKPVLRNIQYVSRTASIIWNGWFSRMDRIGDIMFRANQSALNYSKNVLFPEVHRLYSMCPKGKVALTLQVPSKSTYYTIHKADNRFNDSKNELSYSSGYNGNLVFSPTMCQNPNWESEYIDWENNFQLGENFSRMVEMSNSKWSRFHKASGVFTYILSAKLEEVHKKYEVGDIIELNITGVPYRFEKIDRRYTQNRDSQHYISWKELSTKPIVKTDLSGIIPKLY